MYEEQSPYFSIVFILWGPMPLPQRTCGGQRATFNSFHHVGPRDGTLVSRIGSLYPLSCLPAQPQLFTQCLSAKAKRPNLPMCGRHSGWETRDQLRRYLQKSAPMRSRKSKLPKKQKKKKTVCFHLGTHFLLFNATATQERKTFMP